MNDTQIALFMGWLANKGTASVEEIEGVVEALNEGGVKIKDILKLKEAGAIVLNSASRYEVPRRSQAGLTTVDILKLIKALHKEHHKQAMGADKQDYVVVRKWQTNNRKLVGREEAHLKSMYLKASSRLGLNTKVKDVLSEEG